MTKSAKQTEPVLASDLLQGAAEIGDFLGFELPRTFRLLEKGDLPAFKLRGKWCARKSTLIARIEKLEAAASQ